MTSPHESSVASLDDRLLSTRDAAEFLGLHPVTLRKYRQSSVGPEWTVLPGSHQIRYALGELKRWAGIGKRRAA